MTPLHWAVSYQRIEIINLLLSVENIDLNIKDDFDSTPKTLVAQSENQEIIDAFCRKTGESSKTYSLPPPIVNLSLSSSDYDESENLQSDEEDSYEEKEEEESYDEENPDNKEGEII